MGALFGSVPPRALFVEALCPFRRLESTRRLVHLRAPDRRRRRGRFLWARLSPAVASKSGRAARGQEGEGCEGCEGCEGRGSLGKAGQRGRRTGKGAGR